MELNGKALAALVHGAYRTNISDDGWLSFKRLTDRQLERLFSFGITYPAIVSSSVTVEFFTDADELSFECRFPEISAEPDTVDVYVDDMPVAVFCAHELPKDGSVVSVRLPEGEKHVVIYMPSDAVAEIRNLRVSGAVERAARGDKVLFIGDSITQGYGPYMTGAMYVNCLTRMLGYETLNQGVGGYWYDEKSVMPLDGFVPDKIIVAMGTNQHNSDDREERIRAFYAALAEVYPKTPKLAVTPLWRNDDGCNLSNLKETSRIIVGECARYGIPVADGFALVPNEERFFKDSLHPNATGALVYALRLKAEILRRGF